MPDLSRFTRTQLSAVLSVTLFTVAMMFGGADVTTATATASSAPVVAGAPA